MKAKRPTATRKRKVSCPKLPMQRHLPFASEGRFHDLRAIFDKINGRYFSNRMRGYKIMWGRKRKQKPKEYFVFGTIQEEDRVIRIHPLLDARFVPQWFLEYVIYHEMLHAFVPDKFDENGRRIVHHEKFNSRERKFHFYRRAKKWEDENLARFLR
jgi:hypothetical protein